MADITVQRTVWVPADEVADIKRIAAGHDVTVREGTAEGIGPLILIPLIILGTIAAVGLVDREIDRWRGGQVIDLTGEQPKFYRSHGVVFGLVVVIRKDGTISVDVKQPTDTLTEVITAVQGLLSDIAKDTLTQATAAIQTAVGDKATVTSSDHPDVAPAES
jgi:hypothetical protein